MVLLHLAQQAGPFSSSQEHGPPSPGLSPPSPGLSPQARAEEQQALEPGQPQEPRVEAALPKTKAKAQPGPRKQEEEDEEKNRRR